MDTVRLAWNGEINPREIERRIMALGEQGQVQGAVTTSVDPERAYKRRVNFRLRGHEFCLLSNPRFMKRTPSVALSCHLSRFVTFERFQDLSAMLLGSPRAVAEAKVARLDLCVNMAVPFDTFFKGAYRPRVRKMLQITSKTGRSLYLGAGSNQLLCYERQVPKADVDWGTAAAPSADDKCKVIRVERRYEGKAIPIQSISEIEKLRRLKPFADVRVHKLDPAILSTVGTRKLRVLESFLYNVDLYGFHVARSQENKKGRNFAKSIAHYVGKVEIDFEAAWKHRLDRFFGEVSCMDHNPAAETQEARV